MYIFPAPPPLLMEGYPPGKELGYWDTFCAARGPTVSKRHPIILRVHFIFILPGERTLDVSWLRVQMKAGPQ